jgi:hypothetical protein
LRRPIATLLCLPLAGGCSFIFSEGPPAQHQMMPYFDCSSSYAPPVIDTLWGGLNLVGAFIAMSASEEDWRARGNRVSRGAAIGVGLAWAALSGSSAVYGYNKVGQCKQAKNELQLRHLEGPPGRPPPGYQTPGYPPPGPPRAPGPPPPAEPTTPAPAPTPPAPADPAEPPPATPPPPAPTPSAPPPA